MDFTIHFTDETETDESGEKHEIWRGTASDGREVVFVVRGGYIRLSNENSVFVRIGNE